MGIRDFFMSDEERAKKRQERIKAAQAAKKDNDRKNDIVRMMTSKMFEYGEQCVLIAGCALDDDKTPSSIALLEKRMLIFSGGDYAKDTFGSLIVIGILAMFTFQIFENIAMAMGIMPVTGITLPFISYGGSSVVANMIALGIVLNVGIRSKTINF
jgi:hypothetical protein